jgi:N-acylneuraminate cytidylyltransferase
MHSLLGEDQCHRRQDTPKIYALNGAVYVADCEWLVRKGSFVTDETVAYLMPRERSVDIDSELDIKLAELLLNLR